METSAELLTSWQMTLSPSEQQIIVRLRIGTPGEHERPVQDLALTLPTARMLQRQLAESIRLLEDRSAEGAGATERRKAQQPVARDRRKARHFEGSPSSRDEEPRSDQSGRPNTEE